MFQQLLRSFCVVLYDWSGSFSFIYSRLLCSETLPNDVSSLPVVFIHRIHEKVSHFFALILKVVNKFPSNVLYSYSSVH